MIKNKLLKNQLS